MIKQQKLLIFCRKAINSACNPLWYHEILSLYIGFHVIPSRACRSVPFRPSAASFSGVFKQFSAEKCSKMLFFLRKTGFSSPFFTSVFSKTDVSHGFFVWSHATGLRAALRPPTGAVIVTFPSLTSDFFSFFVAQMIIKLRKSIHKYSQKYSTFSKVFTDPLQGIKYINKSQGNRFGQVKKVKNINKKRLKKDVLN